MLLSLSIRNLAIIDTLELEFGSGFTALTGETGAGKSILIDAIGLAIGTRAEASLVRTGQDRAEIAAEFGLQDAPLARDWLKAQEMLDPDDANNCVLRRVVYSEGRTRAFVNNVPVSASALRELGESLLEVFGQNQSQTLVRAETQRALLDGFANLETDLASVGELWRQWQALGVQIERIGQAGVRDPAQLEFLDYQIRELEALNLKAGEIEQLDLEHRRLSGSGRLLEDGGRALDLLYGGEASVYDQLSTASQLLSALASVDPEFGEAEGAVGAAQHQVRDSAQVLQRLLDRLDLDPAEFARVERRVADVHELARKHRLRAEELPAHLDALREQLRLAHEASGGAEKLISDRLAIELQWRRASLRLSENRGKAAQALSEKVTLGVRGLGMSNAQFMIVVEHDATAPPRIHGGDEVRFDFSANLGQLPRPIAKVASGGELSRLSLAIQVACRQRASAATMIFDEVDAGIGGGVAEIVGQQLRALGVDRQVLCVTHLAQVAAQAACHHGITKEVRSGNTFTRVRLLDPAQRVEELARMMGGIEITASTQAHARELLERAAL